MRAHEYATTMTIERIERMLSGRGRSAYAPDAIVAALADAASAETELAEALAAVTWRPSWVCDPEPEVLNSEDWPTFDPRPGGGEEFPVRKWQTFARRARRKAAALRAFNSSHALTPP